ncbi:uncharacterized protein NECHADRAFT_74253 [Fusarium vanettenii 77-13-4]|uniref:Uncharacterized protein n=1 Tax=Fusarium vanettenii (strain ATCC MYA-4622 / CBS 123669 / FGSC 9596 / NRRL 45880 / 77-13-4) TaxID=660122 RepID=C7YWC2_FUSV7|nr:uncharacterized protein NECHADRAFT_74253 [Fusarium vanettenii 77-13-4]EEU44154.1 predicted protein [Fusarium vanettenii 77-13-4]
MAPWGSWDPEPPSEANNVVTGRDFTVVDLPTDKINEREYGTVSPAFAERNARKDFRDLYSPEYPYAPGYSPFQPPGPPREVPCLGCTIHMMVGGFRGLCRDRLANANGECFCCVVRGIECEEVPEAAFKAVYELQTCARKMDEGHENTDWKNLCNRVDLALLKARLPSFPRQDTNNYWDGNNHVEEVANGKVNQVHNGKTGWGGSDNIDVNANANQVNIAKTYWNDDSSTNWNVNENVNVNADTSQAGNNRPDWDDTGVARWNTTWDSKRNTNWGDDSDSDSDKVLGIETTPTSEIDNDCDDESDDVQDPIQLTPEFSSADKIISAIDRNTDVVADLCEIMEGLKSSLEVLHEDNVQSKKLLQKLLNEQRTLCDKQT